MSYNEAVEAAADELCHQILGRPLSTANEMTAYAFRKDASKILDRALAQEDEDGRVIKAVGDWLRDNYGEHFSELWDVAAEEVLSVAQRAWRKPAPPYAYTFADGSTFTTPATEPDEQVYKRIGVRVEQAQQKERNE